MADDPLALHMRPCPACAKTEGGRIHVTVTADLTLIACDKCNTPGRTLCAAAGIPFSAVVQACERRTR